mmetsp:Transcript_7761/g.25782  ORF Transcript_7761/g.25782 Transcript_7761/m.25782 type:complete len:263 (-) Transcript_7761:798-1586(-)
MYMRADLSDDARSLSCAFCGVAGGARLALSRAPRGCGAALAAAGRPLACPLEHVALALAEPRLFDDGLGRFGAPLWLRRKDGGRRLFEPALGAPVRPRLGPLPRPRAAATRSGASPRGRGGVRLSADAPARFLFARRSLVRLFRRRSSPSLLLWRLPFAAHARDSNLAPTHLRPSQRERCTRRLLCAHEHERDPFPCARLTVANDAHRLDGVLELREHCRRALPLPALAAREEADHLLLVHRERKVADEHRPGRVVLRRRRR